MIKDQMLLIYKRVEHKKVFPKEEFFPETKKAK